MSAAEHCLNEEQMRLSVSDFESFTNGKIVPLLIVTGISGNIINLSVLLDGSMRTRSNTLLAWLAMTDIFFLLCMIPHSLATYSTFASSFSFRVVYLSYKLNLLGMLNWASVSAIWLVLLVCLERLLAIRWPLVARSRPRLSLSCLLPGIFTPTGLLTAYNHFSYHCAIKYFCNGTQPHSVCLHQDSEVWFKNQSNPNGEVFRLIARWNPLLHALVGVLLPILLVAASNVALILTIRQRQEIVSSSSDGLASAQRVEQKVTLTVTAIVTSFSITQGPSAVVFVIAAFWPHVVTAVVLSLSTCLVVLGKTLNFVLFCMSSGSFRVRLLQKTRLLRRQTTRKLTVLTMGDSSVTETQLMLSEKRSNGSAAGSAAHRHVDAML